MAGRRGSRTKKRGRRIDPDDIKSAFAAAYRLLIFRDRSEHELRNRLRQKGYSAETVQTVIESLKNDGFLNDLEFAKSFVRTKNARGLAPELIFHKLRSQFGIDDETVNRAIASEYDRERAIDEIKRLMGIKLSSMKGKRLDEIKRRLASFAVRRGFPPSEAFEMAEQVMKNFEEEHKDENNS